MSKLFRGGVLLALIVWAPLANGEDSPEGGAPGEPPSWTWLQEVGDGHLTMTQDGLLALAVTYPQNMEFELHEMLFSVTITDSEGAEIAGEATYHAGWYRLMWRQADGGTALTAGAELSAHIELINHPDSWVEDIIEDLPVVVAAEPTPDVQQVEVIDHVATDPYESSNYTCVFPATNMTYRAADTSPPWMSSMLYYVVENLDSAGESLHTDNRFPLWEGERPTWSWYASYDTSKEDGTLGESYCVRITTVRMDDASSAMIESCVDAAAFDDLLEEGEVLCTEDNLASHRIPAETHDESTDDDATSSTGCGAAPMALSPWLVGLYLIARRRERVTGVRRRG